MPVWKVSLVAGVAQKVMKKNPYRRSITIKNDSASNVYYGHHHNVATSGFRQGFLIPPNGGTMEDEFHKGEVWLIAAAAVSVSIIEDTPEIEEIVDYLIKRKEVE